MTCRGIRIGCDFAIFQSFLTFYVPSTATSPACSVPRLEEVGVLLIEWVPLAAHCSSVVNPAATITNPVVLFRSKQLKVFKISTRPVLAVVVEMTPLRDWANEVFVDSSVDTFAPRFDPSRAIPITGFCS